VSLDRNNGGLLYRLREHKLGNGKGEMRVYRRLFDAIERKSKKVMPSIESSIICCWEEEKGDQ